MAQNTSGRLKVGEDEEGLNDRGGAPFLRGFTLMAKLWSANHERFDCK